jgi:hypothetical protein
MVMSASYSIGVWIGSGSHAAARAGGGQPRGRRLDRRLVGALPFEKRVLHRILGISTRAEDAVGEPQQAAPRLLEHEHVIAIGHVSASTPESGSTG